MGEKNVIRRLCRTLSGRFRTYSEYTSKYTFTGISIPFLCLRRNLRGGGRPAALRPPLRRANAPAARVAVLPFEQKMPGLSMPCNTPHAMTFFYSHTSALGSISGSWVPGLRLWADRKGRERKGSTGTEGKGTERYCRAAVAVAAAAAVAAVGVADEPSLSHPPSDLWLYYNTAARQPRSHSSSKPCKSRTDRSDRS